MVREFECVVPLLRNLVHQSELRIALDTETYELNRAGTDEVIAEAMAIVINSQSVTDALRLRRCYLRL
ncbi:hypothetical protein DPMN_126453 [Dreissena polymorpha]|uniref:Uncharacterized protein n=1 Tax=Dreissena polymorpha TaxID=45954 RepID=A0A9D4JUH4_DREPO|nr:hypothetical protein DPMN_126453 [Dreissena polymorpha]